MTTPEQRRRLIAQLRTTYAMEAVLASIPAPVGRRDRRGTLRQRLAAYGERPPRSMRAGRRLLGSLGDLVDRRAGLRREERVTVARLVMAAYDVLERLARRAGDEQTARAASKIRREEEVVLGE